MQGFILIGLLLPEAGMRAQGEPQAEEAKAYWRENGNSLALSSFKIAHQTRAGEAAKILRSGTIKFNGNLLF